MQDDYLDYGPQSRSDIAELMSKIDRLTSRLADAVEIALVLSQKYDKAVDKCIELNAKLANQRSVITTQAQKIEELRELVAVRDQTIAEMAAKLEQTPDNTNYHRETFNRPAMVWDGPKQGESE